MADSLTIKYPDGKADATTIDPTNSATATAVGDKQRLIGPPFYGAPRTQGNYTCSIAGTNGTFKWLKDEGITGASPTTFSYALGPKQ